MPGSPVKRGSFGNWAIIDKPPIISGCGGCKHYQEDGSCSALPVMANSLGRYAYKNCKAYSPASATRQSLAVQKSCPFCIYVQAANTYICNQSDSKRYSYECTLCEWYADEYGGSRQKVSESVINYHSNEKDKSPIPTKEKGVILNKQEQITQRIQSESSGKKAIQSKPNQDIDSTAVIKQSDAHQEEYERKLQITTSEYAERLDPLVLEYRNKLTQKERLLQSANLQLEEQKAKMDRLIADNEQLLIQVTELRNALDIKSQTELDANVELIEKQTELDQLNAEKQKLQAEIVQLRSELDSNAKSSKSFFAKLLDFFGHH